MNELITQAQQGNQQAFGELYNHYAGSIFRYIMIKVPNKHQAEDVLQEIFVKVWHALPNFKLENGNFSAWVYRIAGNTIHDFYRKLYRSPQMVELTDSLEIAGDNSSLENMVGQEDLEAVKKALFILPEQYRTVLELRFVQDFTLAETAEILNKSNLAVRLLQHRALKQLHQKLPNTDFILGKAAN